MKGQERTEDIFEREWREAFEGVQEAPPRIVWSEIDRALAHDKVLTYKKKSVYYRWVAAAVFLLATSIGLIQIASDQMGGGGNTIAEAEVDNPTLTEKGLNVMVPERKTNNTGGTKPPTGKSEVLASSAQPEEEREEQLATVSEPDSGDSAFGDRNNVKLQTVQVAHVDVKSKRSSLEGVSPRIVDAIYRVPTYNFGKKKKASSRVEEQYWAGVDVNSGTFDPNFQSTAGSLNSSLALSDETLFTTNNSDVTSRNSPTVRENMTSGQLLAVGINMGMRVSERWTIQGGFQYMQADATNNTNVEVITTRIVDKIAVTGQTSKLGPVQDVVQQETEIKYDIKDVDLDNQFQFASIPVKAGYRILDKKFSLELNGGVAANLYLGNKVSDPNDEYAAVTIGPGSDSPYKELSFMGLASVQIGYQFIDKFDVVIEPNYRRALNDFTKGSSDFSTTPSGFGLQTGIRYRFN